MANTKSAEKAARRAETNRNRNVALRSRMRTALRKVNDALAAGNKADAIGGAQGSPADGRLAGQQERHSSQQGRAPQERPVGPHQGVARQVIRSRLRAPSMARSTKNPPNGGFFVCGGPCAAPCSSSLALRRFASALRLAACASLPWPSSGQACVSSAVRGVFTGFCHGQRQVALRRRLGRLEESHHGLGEIARCPRAWRPKSGMPGPR